LSSGARCARGHPISLFLLKRLAAFIATLLAASAVIFAVLDVLPGNVAEVMLGESATPESMKALSTRLGLDRPPLQRYGDWMAGLARGDLGTSVAALALGVFAAARHNKLGDFGVMVLSQIGIAVPSFWFAILLVWLFAVKLQWVSAGGFPGWEEGLWQGLKALLLPTLALAVFQTAILARITRSAVLEVLREDFVRTARAKGLSRGQTLWRHVLRNAFVAVLTIMGLQFANLLAGTVIVESVFSLPGLGRLIFQAILNRDLVIVRNIVMLLAAAVIVINFVVDVLYAVIDPRLRVTHR
jgi:peptide/nickel transport system permease protein